ncbi:PREDICTED: testis-expressed sequence 101 protein-like [Elephantulus edwardii]|uniref:testis-expressed sequence 101 protein-like n=1 Tax=Elephantulus edwardii TaxID=28737 RepID=UPI0003F0A8FC|nr:PREDICTED: testis-expressed sequence 101 protein-like [Elephantulus edwardii]
MDLVMDSINAFNWTTEETTICGNGSLCQESILIILAGPESIIVASKGCIPDRLQQVTLVRHASFPGLKVVSFSNFCEENYCNNRPRIPPLWIPPEDRPVPKTAQTHSCPTCLAPGTCSNAPSIPCPREATRCYQGKFQLTGGVFNSSVEVRGCTAINGCKLMGGIFTIGVIEVEEVCPQESFTQFRRAENGATRPPISFWGLELLLPLMLLLLLLLLQPLTLRS